MFLINNLDLKQRSLWTLSIILIFVKKKKKYEVLETGFCLNPRVKPIL